MYKKMAISMILAIFFILLDLLLKNFVVHSLNGGSINLLSDYLQLRLAKNPGIAFSLPLSGPLLNIFILIVIALLLYFYITQIIQKKEKFIFPLTFIIIGALINVTDRLRFGYVIDYFDLRWFTIFNVADCMIFFGAVAVLFKNQDKEKE